MGSNLWVREARLYEPVGYKNVECGTCERRCVIREGELGFCKTRKNTDGKLYTIVYGDISSISVNPIEKKPFFHFWPGSEALTVGTWSCNFTCPWCQNWTLSKSPPNPAKVGYMSPDRFVSVALRKGCEGTSISFNEPTLLLEYSLDLFPSAHSKGLYNTYVSNGYMTLDALRMLAEKHMDAIKFDVKGDGKAVRRYCGADVNVVWRNAKEAKRLGMHVEIVNLVIPNVNDRDDAFREIAARTKEIGNDTPLHFTQFYPAYKSVEVGLVNPTPTETLERARDIAMDEGLRYAYVGNVPGHPYENTYCPNCGQMLIKRWAFSVLECKVTADRKCTSCGNRIPIVGKYKID